MLKGPEIALVKRAQVELIFYDASFHDTIAEIAAEQEQLRTLVMMQQGRGRAQGRQEILDRMTRPDAEGILSKADRVGRYPIRI